MEKEEKKKRKGKGNVVIVTILIVLLLIAFLGIGFAIGTKKTADFVVKEANNETNKTENLSIYDKIVTDSLDSFEQIGFDPEKSYESSVTDLTKKELIITALKGLQNEQINFCTSEEYDLKTALSVEDLNNSLKKAVPDGKISLDDITNNANGTASYALGGYGYSFRYKNGILEEYGVIIKDNKIYVIGPCGHVGPYPTNLATQTEKAELAGDNLYIYRKVAFGKTEYEANLDEFVFDYYSDKDYKTKEETKRISEEPAWNLYKTHKMIFKKNGDKYYFESSKVEK